MTDAAARPDAGVPPASDASAAAEAAATAASAPDVVLQTVRLTKAFGGLVAVRSVDFQIRRGQIASLIGPNGAGKTTLFNVIAGLSDPTSGHVEFLGERMVARSEGGWLEPVLWIGPALIAWVATYLASAANVNSELVESGVLIGLFLLIAALLTAIIRPAWYNRLLVRLKIFKSARPNDMVGAGIGRTFQNIRLFANMTALENVLVGMHGQLKSSPLDAVLRTPKQVREEERAREDAAYWLRYVGLRGRDDEIARNLPYGDQRRLEIARALATKPKLLLLDEPTAGMNPSETATMTQLFDRIRRELGLTILLIEHDMRVVMGISDQVTVLDHGEKIAEGPPDQIRRDPRVIEAYLGKGAV